MNESDFKRKLVAGCEKLGAYAVRHEDRYGLGRLDLSIKFPKHPHLLAEGKMVPHQSFAPTKLQYIQGERYIKAEGLCCLIGWDSKTKAMFIHPWTAKALKADCFPPGGSDKDYATTLKDYLDWLATNSPK